MRFSSVFLGVAGLGSVVSVAACSSEEFKPTSSTGGTSGDASVGGSGGTSAGGTAGGGSGGTSVGGTGGSSASGGTGGVPQGCTLDSECDDGKACNGLEKCTNKTCSPGAPVDCANPDSVHCDAMCVEDGGGKTSCVVKGKDADGDGHLDKGCATSSATADDCDDSNKKVYTGATESCDGVDNDCNGKDELDEGTVLPTSVSDLVKGSFIAENPAIAWEPTGKRYGVAWTDDRVSNVAQVHFLRMSVTGDKLGNPPTDELQLSSGAGGAATARIAAGHGRFAVVWRNEAAQKIMLQLVGSDGALIGTAKQLSDGASKASNPDVAATPGGFVAVWSDKRSNTWGALYARAFDKDGAVAGGGDSQVGTSVGSNQFPRATSNGSEVLVGWNWGSAANANVVKSMKLSSTLGVSGEKSLTPEAPAAANWATLPAVASAGGGWAIAWRRGGSPETVEYRDQLADGTLSCSSGAVATANIGVPGGVAVRGGSRVVAWGEDSALQAKVRLTRFKSGCASPVTLTVSPSETPAFDPRGVEVAWSDNGIAFVWTDWASGKGVIRRWVAGPNLCDAPVP